MELNTEVPMLEHMEWSYGSLMPKFKNVIRKIDFRAFNKLARGGRSWKMVWPAPQEYKATSTPKKCSLTKFTYRTETTPATHRRSQVSVVTEIESL